MFYDDSPRIYPRDDLPKLGCYSDGIPLQITKDINFQTGELWGSVSGKIGLEHVLKEKGYLFIVTSDTDAPNSVFEKKLPEADIVISQPAPFDHPWRAPHHGMTPHVSETALSAQARYATDVREIRECWFEKNPIHNENLFVQKDNLSDMGAYSYTADDTTRASKAAEKFKKG